MYPNSVYKTGLLYWKFDLTTAISSDISAIGKLADTVLSYDSLSSTKLWVGEILIKRDIDLERGANLVRESFPLLNVVNHRYRALTLMAQYDKAQGNFAMAKENLQAAIHVDSTRYEAWYAYLALARAKEDLSATNVIQTEIEQLEEKDLLEYSEESMKSPNLFKNDSSFQLTDMKGRTLALSSFRN